MNIIVDENLPPRFAEILCLLGHTANHVTGLGLAGLTDPAWIPQAREHASIVFSSDVRISRRKAEVDALLRNQMHLFVFPSGVGLEGWLMLFLARQHDIQQHADACAGRGAAFSVKKRRVIRLVLPKR